MSHERAHLPAEHAILQRRADLSVAPGASSRTAHLAAPSQPIVSGLLQRKARDANGVAADAESAVASASSSAGFALPAPLMRKFESSLGADLSSVRVHTGADSAAAASAVGAKAYTVGQDIHFGPGHYDPSSAAGEHLLAHEVAHTVQQAGGAASARQHKLEVSSPGDALEHEADRAADAMVAGESFAVSMGGGILSRADEPTPADDDKAWARDARIKVQAVQDAVNDAVGRLNDEGTKAIGGLRMAERSYVDFERRYAAALERFKAGVEEAQKASKELQDNVLFVGKAIIGPYATTFMDGMKTVTGIVEKADKVCKIAGGLGLPTKAPKGPAEPSKDVGPSDKVDWHELISTAIGTLEAVVKQNRSLAEMAKLATKNERFLDATIDGTVQPYASATPEGRAAATMADNSMLLNIELQGIGVGISTGPVEFGKTASKVLDSADSRKIEQDIAIKWMSTLQYSSNGLALTDQTEEIDTARSYLQSLGIEKRLGYDAGLYMSDYDQRLLAFRARTEQSALARVGSAGEWLGGVQQGEIWVGRVRVDGLDYAARGTGLAAAAGGNVRVESYSIAPITEDFGWHGPEKTAGRMHELVTFRVSAMGPLGGGAPPDGPRFTP
jgi:hypothetical protein